MSCTSFDRIDDLEDRAYIFYKVKDYKGAARAYETLVNHNPFNSTYLSRLGKILMKLDRQEDALPYLEKSVEINPTKAQARSNLALCLMTMHEFEMALPHLKEAVNLDQKNPSHKIKLADCLLTLGYTDEGIQLLKDVLKDDPTNASLYNDLGCYFSAVNRHAEALPCFETAVRLNQQDAVFKYNLGYQHKKMAHSQQAISSLRAAYAISTATKDGETIDLIRERISSYVSPEPAPQPVRTPA